jgi:hypothetical protein
MWSGMVQFPVLVPPTVDHSDDWLIVHGDENQLAQEEAELEEKVLCYAFVCVHLAGNPFRRNFSLFFFRILQLGFGVFFLSGATIVRRTTEIFLFWEL